MPLHRGIVASGISVLIPNAPTITSSPSNINGQVTVTWNALTGADTGGSAILSYTLQHSASSDFSSGVVTVTGIASTSHTVSSLENGTTRYFKVAGVNVAGTGTYSGTASATPSTAPGTPTNVQGTANGVTSSTVTWTAPAAANTGPNFTDITGYKVEYAISPYSSYTEFTANTGNANTSISVTGLTNGGSYRFKVTARNSNGLGTTSAESAVVVTNIVPGAPTIGAMTLSTTNTTDSLAWTAPAANGGSAITGYVYQTTTNDGSTFTTAVATGSTSTTKTFDPGYTNVTTKVRVAAVNSLGTPGPYSAISTVGYGGWSNPSYTITDASECSNCAACPCPSCAGGCNDCGTRSITGSKSITGTKGYKSKTCYKWTRGAQETGASYDQNSTAACTAAYGSCSAGDCGCSAGDCGCSACSNSWSDVTASGTYDYPGHGSQAFTYVTDGFTGFGFMYMNNDPQGIIVHGTNCGGPSNGNYYVYNRYYCSAGAGSYKVTPYGCVDTIFAK